MSARHGARGLVQVPAAHPTARRQREHITAEVRVHYPSGSTWLEVAEAVSEAVTEALGKAAEDIGHGLLARPERRWESEA